MSGAPPCRVILVGMMGSGKTTLGNELARRTGWPYHDNDHLLAEATGKTARDLALDGQRKLHAAEAAALESALSKPAPSITASAASVVLDAALRDRLRRAGLVVWLRAGADVLAKRAGRGPHRPWLAGDAEAWLAAAAAEREPLYREVAWMVVDTESEAPGRLAQRIIAGLATTHCREQLGILGDVSPGMGNAGVRDGDR